MSYDGDFVCQEAMPGWACHMPEMSTLGILFFLEAILCVLFFISAWRRFNRTHPNRSGYWSMTSDIVFWVFMTIWCIYEGLLRTVYFPYDRMTLNFFYSALIGLTYLIPLSAMILMICELLIDYRGSSKRFLTLFRVIFAMFFGAFVILGIGFSMVIWGEENNPGSSIALWHGCLDLIIALFVGAPAYSLMRLISFPVVPTEHRKCISITKVLTAIFCGIMVIRSLYNITHGLGCNPVDQTLAKESMLPGKPSWKARTLQLVFVFLFDFCTSIAAICGVWTWRMNDVKFADRHFCEPESVLTQEGDVDGRHEFAPIWNR
jgi:hypothetical protein